MGDRQTALGAWRGSRLRVILIAGGLTLLNAAKPVTVDDPAYLSQAERWAAHPSDPLGGEAILYQTVVPAARVTSAPVGIAWLALGARVVGTNPLALKLWLFPFAWLVTWALDVLLRRLSPTLAAPLLALVVLSPSLLPSFNFMLDLPALALALAALALFVRAPAGGRGAVAAGVLAGLALQTKYSSAPALIALVALAVLARRGRAGVLAAAVALAVFVAIEGAMLAGAGASPLREYLASRMTRDPGGHVPLVTAKRLVLLLGSSAAPLIPLGLAALGAPRRLVHATLAGTLAGYLLLACAPSPLVARLAALSGGRLVNLDNLSVGWMGPVLVAIGVLGAWRAVRAEFEQSHEVALSRALVVWLVAECVAAPFVSASGSVRRLLGAIVALTLTLACLTERRVRRDPRRRLDVTAIAVAGVALGLMFWAVDFDSALAERRTLARVLERTAAVSPGRVAFVGDHWGGFQYQARRAGLRPVFVGRSSLRRGDWLALPFGVEMRGVELDSGRTALADSVPLVHRLPLTTRRSYYDGRQAIRRTDPTWIGAYLYRVTNDGPVLRTHRLPVVTPRPGAVP